MQIETVLTFYNMRNGKLSPTETIALHNQIGIIRSPRQTSVYLDLPRNLDIDDFNHLTAAPQELISRWFPGYDTIARGKKVVFNYTNDSLRRGVTAVLIPEGYHFTVNNFKPGRGALASEPFNFGCWVYLGVPGNRILTYDHVLYDHVLIGHENSNLKPIKSNNNPPSNRR